MSKVDELFKELRYEKDSSKMQERYDLYNSDYAIRFSIRIVFNHKTKRMDIHSNQDVLDINELRVINEKCKEMG